MSTLLAEKSSRVAQCGRVLLLLLLAGLLFLRQEFSHRNLGELPILWGGEEWKFLEFAYLSEVVMLLLLPLAVMEFFSLKRERFSGDKRSQFNLWSWPFILASAFIAWGGIHALYAMVFSSPRDSYLIVRQTALAGYGLFFIYGVIFFQRDSRFIKNAAWVALASGVLAAGVDWIAARQLDPVHSELTPRWAVFFNEKPYGQETLVATIFGAALLVIFVRSWLWKAVLLALCGFAGWRQGMRFQSVVPISMAGAIAAYLLFGSLSVYRGQYVTLRRAVLLVLLLAFAGAGYLKLRTSDREDQAEVGAWGWKPYAELFEAYDHAPIPTSPAEYVFSRRGRGLVSNPEVYRLNAVFDASKNVNERNNIWRLLVWRQMASDWRSGHYLLGAGVGKRWFYDALYDTQFHYGEDRLGLDPHNSFLNTLYRFGAVGLLLLLVLIGCVSRSVLSALRRESSGDILLESLILYFFYTLVFSNFTVALEGPAYAMPFWFSLALLYIRARQILALEPSLKT